VRRVLVDGDRCTGVEVEGPGGSIERIDARLVVLCGGSIMSPAIMMRSGLGPRAHLESLGIDVLRDVPSVGRNLSDHPALSVQCRVKDAALVDVDAPIIQTILRYTAAGSDKRNDLQIEQLSFTSGRRDPPTFGIAAVLEYQYGRGELRLNSADPHEHPVIDLRFCEDERDTARLVGCFRDALAFTRTPPLADLIEQVTFPRPGSELDDETIAGLCRRRAGSGYHPSGTVKMGPAGDAHAVVDQHGCCHALSQLVVADASIMPAVPRANTNLTSIMIGEMVGEWLRTRPSLFGL